jgi:hypothetical protein
VNGLVPAAPRRAAPRRRLRTAAFGARAATPTSLRAARALRVAPALVTLASLHDP